MYLKTQWVISLSSHPLPQPLICFLVILFRDVWTYVRAHACLLFSLSQKSWSTRPTAPDFALHTVTHSATEIYSAATIFRQLFPQWRNSNTQKSPTLMEVTLLEKTQKSNKITAVYSMSDTKNYKHLHYQIIVTIKQDRKILWRLAFWIGSPLKSSLY